ncbi:MAG: ABC transporter ATP-binding permease protein [Candidatus Magasanikbacteria bacterium GW2011_GWA2_56_11]|uniref:ABC transporter ATP-binding permease protein n=1 Tax=Candidatus Magasanikbacteria bacterium GW2011_GWA2_56_11 TaxID=1619044 RepID=A0A0G1YFF9_9BACT|nr:MAG: ABC transporter ATP-binding permease protein [Candidatus Magasanikbacteria bacterium GW2011_GWA2_56_11]
MIQAKGLEKKYGQGELQVVALKSLNIEIKDREFVAVVGPSGAGKSTLLYQLSLLDRPTAGEVIVNGHNTSELNEAEKTQIRLRDFGYVFQDYALLPELSTIDNVALPMLMQGMGLGSARRQALQSLARVGLEGKKNNRPSQLSGGQQQRVSIARAIAHNPRILFADEPTANLDSQNARHVIETFAELHRSGQTIIMVTHEQEYAEQTSRIIAMKDGAVVSDSYTPSSN